jgi:3-hydroxyacyl-CoA dehydrogenase
MAALTESVDYTVEGEVAVLTINNPPVNALSHHVRTGLADGLKKAAEDPQAKSAVIHCAGRTFVAGADISEFGKPRRGTPLLELLETIENSPKPVVAAIHGTALGGGLETALACHYRVGVSSAQFGLPEIKLGILPGAGGTQRLPRVVGAEKALDMILSGNPIGAEEALRDGLIDMMAGENGLRQDAIAFASKVVAEHRPLRKISEQDEKLQSARKNPAFFDEVRKEQARRSRNMIAPERCIQAVEAAVNLPFAEGMKLEGKFIEELVASDQSKAQRYYFFAEREAARIPDVPKDTLLLDVKKVGVIGGGTMGGGISMSFANSGYNVTMIETTQEFLDRGLSRIKENYDISAQRGRFTQAEVDERTGRINGSVLMEDLADKDLVIEAVFENMALKKEIFDRLDRICGKDAILATNTSALDINEIASATSRPENVIGLHFFSPANVMKLVEVVRGAKTSKPVIASSMNLAKKISKIPVLVGVCRGFVGNRILYARSDQAQQLLLEGATPWQIDNLLYDFGMPMGPFAMGDMAGLDIGWDPKTSTGSTIRERLCEEGRKGQKTGAGYYKYEGRKGVPDPKTEAIIRELAEKRQIRQRKIGDQEILERLLYVMVNEGTRILEEGIAIRASDIDVVWVNGYGWPVYRGGPMFYGEQIVGLSKVYETLKKYHAQTGMLGLKPSALMERLAQEGKSFAEL